MSWSNVSPYCSLLLLMCMILWWISVKIHFDFILSLKSELFGITQYLECLTWNRHWQFEGNNGDVVYKMRSASSFWETAFNLSTFYVKLHFSFAFRHVDSLSMQYHETFRSNGVICDEIRVILKSVSAVPVQHIWSAKISIAPGPLTWITQFTAKTC